MMNMYEIVARLNEASKAYYNGQDEIMSNKEWDSLFDELKRMEAESGIILPDSPTQKVGAPLVKIKGLKEERHEFPALSLDKTQDFTEYEQKIRKGMGDRLCNSVVLMWKMDGSTIQLTYENGRLQKMATRGDNGEVGYLVTHNASIVNELPLEIPYKGKLVVRGECVMSYAEFDRLKLEDDKYKNARNLANATITMLDTNEASKRELHLRAFNLVYSSEFISDSFAGRLSFLQRQGFGVVPYDLVNIDYLQEAMNLWTEKVEKYEFPVDGLVTAYDDARYADTLSSTNHHPHILRGYAFKWQDKEVETTLRKVEWSPSLNSLNPVAIFDSVELEGTTVSRASLHNVTYLVQKGLHVGNRITVYKANMIIPQVAKNLDKGTDTKLPENIEELFNTFDIPRKCPVCGAGMYGNKSIKKRPDGTKYKDFYYYGCKHRNMQRGYKCDYRKQIQEEVLDAAVAEVVSKLVSNPRFAAMMQEKINMKVDTTAIEQEIAAYEKQLRQHYFTKSRLMEEIDSLDPDDRHFIARKSDLDDRLYKMYDKIEEVENGLMDARAKKQAIEADKITGDNIYKILICFDKLYATMTEAERRRLVEILIDEVQIYPERQPNGQWLKSVRFKLPIIDHDLELSLDNQDRVEVVCSMARVKKH